MTLVRFDPFGIGRDLDRMFEETFRSREGWLPRVDVFEREGTLVVRAETPGIDPESLDITLEGGVLSISGSRTFESETDKGAFHRKEIFEGEFRRTVMLPDGVDLEAVEATSKDGIVEITIPMAPEVLPRKIKVLAN